MKKRNRENKEPLLDTTIKVLIAIPIIVAVGLVLWKGTGIITWGNIKIALVVLCIYWTIIEVSGI